MDILNLELKVVDKEIMKQNKSLVELSKVKEKSHPIVIESFVRTGNTMLRTILENSTNILTGDDMYIPPEILKLYEKRSLSFLGLGKESTIENVTFVKSHFPLMNFPQNKFKAQGVLLAIRNPFDTIESHFHLCATESHSSKIEGKYKSDVLERFCNLYIPKYQEFYEYIINNIIGIVPLHCVIYEDFNEDKISGTKKLFDFIFKFDLDKEYLGGQTPEDIKKKLNSEIDIKDILEKVIYLPKDEKQRFRAIKDNEFYSKEIIEKMITTCYSTLKFFGYINELKKLKNEVVTKAIEKMEVLEKEDYPMFKFKYDNYKQIEEINQKLFESFSEYDKQIERPYVQINDDIEREFNIRAYVFENFWGKIIQ